MERKISVRIIGNYSEDHYNTEMNEEQFLGNVDNVRENLRERDLDKIYPGQTIYAATAKLSGEGDDRHIEEAVIFCNGIIFSPERLKEYPADKYILYKA